MFSLPTVTEEVISEQISKLNIKKSVGLDGILIKFLKIIRPHISKVISHLFNQSLRIGKFPNIWKKARVTPLLKMGNINDMNNYRPISILASISKIIEKIVRDHLMKYLVLNKLISENSLALKANI